MVYQKLIKCGFKMSITRRELMAVLGTLAATSNLYADQSPQQQSRQLLEGLACNMESWWTDLDFMQRFERAAEAGFSSIEFWEHNKNNRNMNAVATLAKKLDLNIVQFTGWGGPSLADTSHHYDFIETMKRVTEIAHQLNAPMFTVVGHQTLKTISQADSLANLTLALETAAPILEDAKKMLILEPFNPVDHPGHFLNGSADALRICREIDSPFIKINWDLYHMQLTEGNIVDNLYAGIDQVGYIQVADIPGRHQPGSGELNYNFIFNAIDAIGYKGPIGLECWPENNDENRAIEDIIKHRLG
jgi:hydroxypyruvate isomerase